MSGIVASTGRVSAIILVASALIALDVFWAVDSGALGLTLIGFLAALRVYNAVAQTSLSACRVYVDVKGSVEGKPLTVEYNVCNNSWIPIALVEVSLVYPSYLKLVRGSPGGLTVIPPRECVKYRAELLARVGKHKIGPLKAVLRDLFGFFRGLELTLGDPVEVKVKPREDESLRRVLLEISRSVGLSRARRPGEGSEFYATRDYKPGDEVRRVYWKALAKGRMAVKEFERESTLHTLFLILADKSMLYGPQLSTPLEHIARITVTIARHLASKGDYVGLLVVSNGKTLGGRLERGWKGYRRVADALSNIDYDSIIGSTENPESGISPEQLVGKLLASTPSREKVNVILINTVEGTEKYSRQFKKLQSLKACTLHSFIIIPHLYGIEKLKAFERAVYRIKTYEDTRKAYDKVRELRREGIKAVPVTPWDAAAKIISKLETVRGLA
ncbi:MAG: DUF58 domain-containing protein [Thermoprotei archaeon]|nr:DUF58 domain-containing protein [Thermoprotei archaeon]